MNAAENEVSHEAGFVPGAEVRYAGQGNSGPPVSLELRISRLIFSPSSGAPFAAFLGTKGWRRCFHRALLFKKFIGQVTSVLRMETIS